MKQVSRTENSLKNVAVAMFAQSGTILLGMISRTVFVKTLGEGYLGISGLFSSIIAVLSLANLGLGDATLYIMIKYFAKGDFPKIQAAFRFTKTIYRVLVIIIIGVGVATTPLISLTVNFDKPIPYLYLYLYYYLFVLNTAFSYFSAPYNAIFHADQKIRVVTRGQFLSNVGISITQIIVLYLNANYAIYLVLMVLTNFIEYFYIRYMFRSAYSYLNIHSPKHALQKIDKKEIITVTKDMFIIKASYAIMDSIDNISISKIVGTIVVGIYSNYLVITEAIRRLVKMVYQSVYSSFGNLNMNSDAITRKKFFEIEMFVLYILGTLSITGIYVLIQDFMVIWLGENFLLNKNVVLLACIDLYLNILMYAQENFIQTSIVFQKTKYLTAAMAVSNLILSILLGLKLGLSGILLATILSRLLMMFIIRPIMIYKKLFNSSVVEYYLLVLRYIFVTLLEVALVNGLLFRINGTIWYMFLLKLLLTVCIAIGFLWIVYRKNASYVYLKNKLLHSFVNRKK